jgi:L-amino acid N-acyltransferase YncA
VSDSTPGSQSFEIREATDADWPNIWPFFSDIVRAGETYAYPADLTEDEGRGLWMERPPGRTVVAVEGDVVLGTAKMGPNRPARGAHIGTASFMVDATAGARGIGRAMAEHVVEWHRQHGYRGIQFNAVVETNERAVALWRSLGFQIIGTAPGAFDHPEHGYVGLHVMFLPLT